MKTLLITGASGFIGQALSLAALKRGYRLIAVSREKPEIFKQRFSLPYHEIFSWDEIQSPSLAQKSRLGNLHAVIHLAGEPIAKGRWNSTKKAELIDSRVRTAKVLTNFLKFHFQNETTKPLFTSASAIGIYGTSPESPCTETAPAGNDFLAELCTAWEKAVTSGATEIGTKPILFRIGLVMGLDGGALAKMLTPFRLGLGGRLGSGKQIMSWIHIVDLVSAMLTALETPLSGPINLVAPNPVTNSEFTKALASALKRSAPFPVPKFALKTILGELESALTSSQNVVPTVLRNLGFQWKYPTLVGALTQLVSPDDEVFNDSVWVKKSLDEVFPFFSSEKNLETLTPPWLHFKVLGKTTPEITQGTEIEYALKLHGVPMRWKSRIDEWTPKSTFVDTQLKGPYKKWHHTHAFESLQGGTLMTDTVRFQAPAGRLGSALLTPFLRAEIRKIFNYRRETVLKIFG